MMIPASADKFFIDNRGISWTRKPQDLRSLSANFAHDRNFGSQVLLSSLLDAANKNRIPNLQLAVCLSKEYGTCGYLTHSWSSFQNFKNQRWILIKAERMWPKGVKIGYPILAALPAQKSGILYADMKIKEIITLVETYICGQSFRVDLQFMKWF